jgi:lipoprotein NlpI
MEIYRLYRGELKPEDVLESVRRGDPSPEELSGRLFYARLYLGLYYEVQKDIPQARKYILLAANEHRDSRRINRYMWDVARIHAQQFNKQD